MASTKGSRFARTMQYFREADPIEARAAIQAAMAIVNERAPQATAPAPKQRKPRTKRAQVNGQAATGDQPSAA